MELSVKGVSTGRKNHRWTIRDLEYLRVMYMVMTRKELAQKLGLKEVNIRDALHRYGVVKPWQKKYKCWTAEDVEIIKNRYRTTKGAVIAAELGVSLSTFRGVVQRYGLKKQARRKKLQPV